MPKRALTTRPPPASACARPAASASASVKALDMSYHLPTLSLCVIGVCGLMDAHRVIRRIRAIK